MISLLIERNDVMEVKLDQLIEKIKLEGVEEGQKQSSQIVRDAEEKAAAIIDNAKKDAEKLLADAKKKADDFQRNSEVAIKQAARDGELLLKTRITELFDRVFKKEVSDTLSPEFLKEMIVELMKQWGKDVSVDVKLSEKNIKALEKALQAGVAGELKNTIQLRPSSEISNGFQIGLKGQNMYYDFTDESIADVLMLFLKPRIKELLGSADG